MQSAGFSQTRTRLPDQASVAYYLMSDNRRRMPSDAYLRAELTEAHDPRHAYPSGAPHFALRPIPTPSHPCSTASRACSIWPYYMAVIALLPWLLAWCAQPREPLSGGHSTGPACKK